MRRRAAIFWHATLSVAAGVLYFFFVLPRWPELIGDTSHGLGTVARIAAGVLIALAALPVVFTLLELRKPEFGTPALGADATDLVCGGPCGGRCADRWHGDQRDLVEPGQRGPVVVRRLRRRGRHRAARHRRVPSLVCCRVAAATAEAAEAQERKEAAPTSRQAGNDDRWATDDTVGGTDDTEAEADDSETDAATEAVDEDAEASDDTTEAAETTAVETESTAEEPGGRWRRRREALTTTTSPADSAIGARRAKGQERIVAGDRAAASPSTSEPFERHPFR